MLFFIQLSFIHIANKTNRMSEWFASCDMEAEAPKITRSDSSFRRVRWARRRSKQVFSVSLNSKTYAEWQRREHAFDFHSPKTVFLAKKLGRVLHVCRLVQSYDDDNLPWQTVLTITIALLIFLLRGKGTVTKQIFFIFEWDINRWRV